MKNHNIDLTKLTNHGNVKTNIKNKTLEIWTNKSVTNSYFAMVGDSFKRHYVSLPEKYNLPMQIEMTVKLDYSFFIIFVGSGHIAFSSPRQVNRKIEDIFFPSGKPNQDMGSFNNNIPLYEWVTINIIYTYEAMQININGEERFFTNKLSYMSKKNRKELEDLNTNGLKIGITVTKGSKLNIKSITVNKYEGVLAPNLKKYNEGKTKAKKEVKPTLESVIAELPKDFRDEVSKMDNFLTSLHPMKFKRSIDKNGEKISWVASDYGFSYQIELGGSHFTHRYCWYIVYNGKPETWHRKADFMEEVLDRIYKTNPKAAERIFYSLNDCVGCVNDSGKGCLAKTLYKFNGQKRLTCHGSTMLRMSVDDFNDTCEFIQNLNSLMAEKGTIPQDKIFLMNKKFY